MKDYLLHTLSPEEFENLVIRISIRVLGTGTISFSKGPDGGRDAKFVGRANKFPSGALPWEGRFIIQAKSTSNPVASCSDSGFDRIIRQEMPRILALQRAGECDAYILFTNRKLSANREQQLIKTLKKETGVPRIAILGKETISSLLDSEPSLAATILTGSMELASPFQVPAPPRDFTGRSSILTQITNAIDQQGVRVIGISGMGGVGKTALALKLASLYTARYPDAQLFVHMGTSQAADVPDAARMVIKSLHPTALLPETATELRNIYYSVLANKRVLLLLDNVMTPLPIEDLIPPSDCLVLVTSRYKMSISGMFAQSLEELSLEDATTLLVKIVPRVSESAVTLANSCGCLPLALRLAGSALAERPNLTVGGYLDRISIKRHHSDIVNASIAVSYNLFDSITQLKWALLSILSDEFRTSDAAIMWDCAEAQADDVLAELVRSSMVSWNFQRSTYRLHDVLKAFAAQELTGPKAYVAALTQARYFSIVLGRAALGDSDESKEAWFFGLAPRVWAQVIYNSDRFNIRKGWEWAQSQLPDPRAARICADYAIASVAMHRRDKDLESLKSWLETGLSAARLIADPKREAAILLELGILSFERERIRDAIQFARECQQVSSRAKLLRIESHAYAILVGCSEKTGDVRGAKIYREKSLDCQYESQAWDLLYEDPLKAKVDEAIASKHFDRIIMHSNPVEELISTSARVLPLSTIIISYVGLEKHEKAKRLCETALLIAKTQRNKKALSAFTFLKKKMDKLTRRERKDSRWRSE